MLWMGIIAVVAGIIGIAIVIFFQGVERSKEMERYASNLPDFDGSLILVGEDASHGIAIDISRKLITLLRRAPGDEITHRTVGFTDIIGSEIHEDGETTSSANRGSQLSGALVGGALLGGVGAVIGGISGSRREKKTVRNLELRLTVNDINSPTHTVALLAGSTSVDRNGIIYMAAAESARQWQGRLEAVIKQAATPTT